MTSSSRTRSSSYGTVNQLPSGKWRARYVSPDGKRRSRTFGTKTDARVFLATTQTDQVRRVWRAPSASKATVGDYATKYMTRPDDEVRPNTKDLYAQVWRSHLEEHWADVLVTDVTTASVREWRTGRQRAKVGSSALAQAYRMLRGCLNLAVADEVIDVNPCRIKGASTAKRQKPVQILTIPQVNRVANSTKLPDKYRAFVLVLAYCAPRFGEASALRRRDVKPDGSSIHIERSQRKGRISEPKTEAGFRDVAAPQFVADALVYHLAHFTGPDDDDLLFGTSSGKFLASQNWAKVFHRALEHEKLPRIRTHELRHTGATLAAQSGATKAELMARIGHASGRASEIYQHAASLRDRTIADALNAAITGG
ncbi:tyrosine-type recombinase/integrase [Kribbella sp. NPDC051770]|uniref:tyrosine-type recombinase/integrase n=1 Tax=Kribbella sp. NPDC051770 TaxID=3155413 RepID=UPI00342D58CE